MIVARAPASTANIGPGFDAAAAALDLWNTVEVEEGPFAVEVDGEGSDELPRDATHLAVQAFALAHVPRRVSIPVHERDPPRARPRL